MVRTRLDARSSEHRSTSSRLRHHMRSAALFSVLGAHTSVSYSFPHILKEPMHDSMRTGEMYIQELLAGHGDRIRNTLGLHRHVFQALVRELKMYAGLKDTKHVSAEEQLAIFLRLARTGLGQREARECFQRSPETVSLYEICTCSQSYH